jgi:hypothetical protein
MDPNTTNEFMVGVSGREFKRLGIGAMGGPGITTKQQAYRLAAWIVLCAEVLPDESGEHTFKEILKAIKNT